MNPSETLPRPPDRYGHADAWWSPALAPHRGQALSVADLDAWAHANRARWAAELVVEGVIDRDRRVESAAQHIEHQAARHEPITAALKIRTDGPGPGPRAIRLDPKQRHMLRCILSVVGDRRPI